MRRATSSKLKAFPTLIMAGAMFLTGCVSTRPGASTDPNQRQDVVLYYATNRANRQVSDPDKFFANQAETPASKTNFGIYPATTDLNGENFVSGNLRIINKADWLNDVRSLAVKDDKPERTILIYVHGYNNDFSDAAEATARLYSGFGENIVPVFYSWPSGKKLLGYTSDERETERSVEYFSDFLTDLVSAMPEAKLAIVAHSMGNRVVMEGLERFVAKQSPDAKMRRIHAAAFFAADVDKDTYAERYSKTVNQTVSKVLIYTSAKDKALAASRKVHGSEPRLGQTDPSPPYHDAESGTIDATAAGSDFLGHGYFAGNRAVISDLAYALDRDIPAWRRSGLKPMPNRLVTNYYWLLVD